MKRALVRQDVSCCGIICQATLFSLCFSSLQAFHTWSYPSTQRYTAYSFPLLWYCSPRNCLFSDAVYYIGICTVLQTIKLANKGNNTQCYYSVFLAPSLFCALIMFPALQYWWEKTCDDNSVHIVYWTPPKIILLLFFFLENTEYKVRHAWFL